MKLGIVRSAVASCLFGLVFSGSVQADLPAVVFGEAGLVSPTGSLTFSPSLCGGTTGATCYSPAAEVSPYIVKMGRSLGANRLPNADFTKNVFNYVYQNINYTPLFGLQKGGVGALIDGYGTAFDQAQLMKLLLEQDTDIGTVSYQYGTLTISLANAKNWLGVAYTGSDQAAVTGVLSNGGIPATVGTTVTVAHLWLTVGTTVYDPAYKLHTYKQGRTRQQLLGCSGGSCATAARNAAGIVATSGSVPTVTNINATNLEAHLQAKAMSVQNNIGRDDELADAIGGYEVDIAATPTAALVATRSGTSWSAIPNDYRTQFGVRFDNINVVFFADEIYGKRLQLMGYIGPDCKDKTTPHLAAAAEYGLCPDNVTGEINTRYANLLLENNLVTTSTFVSGTETNDTMTLSVNHPYPATSGAYMDRVQELTTNVQTRRYQVETTSGVSSLVPRQVAGGGYGFWPQSIITGWGDTGSGLVSHMQRLAKRDEYGILTSENDLFPYWKCFAAATPRSSRYRVVHNWPSNTTVTSKPNDILGAMSTLPSVCRGSQYLMQSITWLAQTRQALGLVERTNESRIHLHHHMGLQSQGRFNVVSGVSISALEQAGTAGVSTRQSIALVLNRLEGSVSEQLLDSWSGYDAVSLLNLTGSTLPVEGVSTYYLVTSSNKLSVWASLVGYTEETKARIASYIDAGYTVLLPQRGKAGTFPVTVGRAGTLKVNTSAFWAYKPDGSASALIVGELLKGANTGNDVAAKTLETVGLQEVQKKNDMLYDVSLASGAITLPPVTDLTVGSGEFPYSLPFIREYSQSAAQLSSLIRVDSTVFTDKFSYGSTPLAPGWTHNYDIKANFTSDAEQAFGQDSALDAVATITAFHILADLAASETTSAMLSNRLASAFVTGWWGKQLQSNAINVQSGHKGQLFVRLPDGTFNPPPLSRDTLQQTGERQGPGYIQPGIYVSGGPSAFYDYNAVTLTMKRANGELLAFIPDHMAIISSSTRELLRSRTSEGYSNSTFKVRKWSFPSGAWIDFSYDDPLSGGRSGGHTGDTPRGRTVIQNNLGRSLTIVWYPEQSDGVIGCISTQRCIHRIEDDEGRVVSYNNGIVPFSPSIFLGPEYHQRSDDFKVTYPDGQWIEYEYLHKDGLLPALASLNPIVRIKTPVDGSTPSLRIEYDELQHVKRIVDARGHGSDYYIGGIGGERRRTAEVVNALSEVSRSVFNEDGAPVETVSAKGTADEQTIRMAYNALGQLVRTTRPEGNYTTNAYDSDYNLTRRTWFSKDGNSSYFAEARYTTKTHTYGPVPVTIYGVLDRVRDAAGHITRFVFDTKGQLTSVTSPTVAEGTPVQSFTYNGYGQLLTATNAETIVTRYNYSGAHSELTSVVENAGGLNLTTSFTYDDVGNRITVNGPLGVIDGKDDIVSTLYDAMRRPTHVVQGALGDLSPGIPLAIQNAGAEHYSYTSYDRLGRPLTRSSRGKLRSGEGLASSFTNQNTESSYVYGGTPCSGSGKVCQVISPDGARTTYFYDALDRVDIVQDGEGRKTKTVYDKLGRPVTIYQGWRSRFAAGAPDNLACAVSGSDQICYQRYGYTANGQVDWVMDANGNKTNYLYDGFDRLRRTEFPSKTTAGAVNTADYEQYEYDNNGNMTAKRTRKGDWIVNSYDALNRLTRKSVRRGGRATGNEQYHVTYTYLKDGRDHVITQSAGTTAAGTSIPNIRLTYGYDSAGRQIGETVTDLSDNSSYDVTSVLDAAGNRTRLTYPGGLQVTYGFDYLGRMKSAALGDGSTGRVTYNYDGFSRRSSSRFYDASGSFRSSLYGYERDNALKYLSHDFREPGGTVGSKDVRFDFDYNLVNQITRRDISNSLYRFNSDFAVKTLGYRVNGLNQYTRISTTGGTSQSPLYDANGSLASDGGGWVYHYDEENRLVKAVGSSLGGDNPSRTISYEYGPKGRRHALVSSITGRTEFVYDGDEPIADYSGSGTLLRRYVNGAGIDERLMYIDHSGSTAVTRYYHGNHQGSIVGLSSQADGSQTHQYSYDAYGVIGRGEGSSQPFRYTGRRYDAEAGLYYYRARYYRADLGRFLQTDPIGYEDTMNLYGYTGNDPVNNTDPSGTTGAAIARGLAVPVLEGLITIGVCAEFCDDLVEQINDSTDEFRDMLWDENGSPRDITLLNENKKQPKKKAKDRRKEQQRKNKEDKHGDPDFEEPASEDYAKWRAGKAEKRGGKKGRRNLHDQKKRGEGDRTKEQLEEDLKDVIKK